MTLSPSEQFHRIEGLSDAIFVQTDVDFDLFYSPGYLVVVRHDQRMAFEEDIKHPRRWLEVSRLREHAQNAQAAWEQSVKLPFEPICLTLYLHNECNLDCNYCYSNPSPHPDLRLTREEVSAAAKLVASNCVKRQHEFVVVFHGGGEPSLHQALANAALDDIEHIVHINNLSLFRYIATNAAMSETKAHWLAKRFDLIGISCDGPPAIQSVQRPLQGGADSSALVERTARILREKDKPFHVRVTITPQTVHQQAAIAEYICTVLKPNEIHVESVYIGGRTHLDDCIATEEAQGFVDSFMDAWHIAEQYDIPWRMSGSRPWQIHGPYCNVYRDVLNLIPGGAVSACFKTTTAKQSLSKGTHIATVDRHSDQIVLDQKRIGVLRQILRKWPAQCDTCFNQFHCARNCPDICPLDKKKSSSDFACHVNQLFVHAILRETAQQLFNPAQLNDGVAGTQIIF